jgi:hypothetical protein
MHNFLNLAAVICLLLIARVVFLLCAPALRSCTWCAPRARRDGRVRPPWWAPWCVRCRGRREHFRSGTRMVARVRVALRRAWHEDQARRAVRKAGGGL